MKKLVFILSSNYSGSHFLSLLLGSHSKAEHLGELKNLYKGRDISSCYLCGEGNCQLFHNIHELPRLHLYQTLFDRVGEDIEFVVDASKKTKWFKHFINGGQYDIRLIHLVRDPRALSRRWLMRFDERGIGMRERIKQCRRHPHKIPLFLFGDLLSVCIYKWYAQNKEITNFLAKSGLPYKRVTYRNLALDTDRTLSDMCDWLDVNYEPQQKNYWEFEHHGTQKHEYEWIKQKGGAQYFDQRWKGFLSGEQVARIENHKLIQILLAQMNLKISEQGLVAR